MPEINTKLNLNDRETIQISIVNKQPILDSYGMERITLADLCYRHLEDGCGFYLHIFEVSREYRI